MTEKLRFYVSHIEVTFYCSDKSLYRGVSALWGCAAVPQVPTTEKVVIKVENEPMPRMFCNDRIVAKFDDNMDLLPQYEAEFYELIQSWHAEYTVLHAALIQRNNQAVLISGPSNSGKSSLSLQAIRSGWQYLSDELVLTDGQKVWGIARAIQFDWLSEDEGLISFLADCDTTSCRWQDPELGPVLQPVYSPGVSSYPIHIPKQEETIVVLVSNGSDAVCRSVNSLDALKSLHEACFDNPTQDLGGLVNRVFHLDWCDPETAMAMIGELTE